MEKFTDVLPNYLEKKIYTNSKLQEYLKEYYESGKNEGKEGMEITIDYF